MIDKKLGYYRCNGIEFDSKIQACIYGTKVNHPISWHFNEEIFEGYNWAIEPLESLDQLYDQRSKEIREKYDYVIISYSGGADSHNIVESFIRQGLHIDEIIVNTMKQANEKFTIVDPLIKKPENAAAEHDLQTVPRLKEIQNRIPNTKITVLDMSDFFLKSWLSAGDASWIMDKKEGLHPSNVTRFNYLHYSEIRKQFDKDKKITVVLGVEKPRTIIHTDGNFYMRFVDRASNVITISHHLKEYPNAEVEYFYWSPDCAKLLCKQAHVIKRWLEANPDKQKFWYSKNISIEMVKLIHERILRTLLYTTWNNEWYQADKALKDWHCEFDSWFINGYKGTKQHYIWNEGIDYIKKNASNFLMKEDGMIDGLKVFYHNYSLGKIRTKTNVSDLLIYK
jgi:hypothetical protein